MAKRKPVPAASPAEYTVVARRYRPQQFAELIGQEHVAQALVNALQTGRVAHAYLFTGARGVGKTSAARILAKALNCEKGPTATPCDQCDSCKAVAEGQDVDVVEIDGASNNRIDEARDLRQNIGFRPTRSRYKVYIIDEVHMLTTQAFNALLKTLEEPPPHVKFIFATTEVQKIPITILSRCQRFDFAHVGPNKIFDQLKSIVGREGLKADDDALRLVARRAGGSMRDSQSLLDQLLASAQETLTAEHVNAVLGTAGDERVAELAAAILAHDTTAALNLVGGWVERGLQVGELVDQLIEYWRSLMLLSCAGTELRDLPMPPVQREVAAQQVRSLSLDTILTGLDVWTTTKSRMRGSAHTQVLLEMAVVRLCRLDEVLSVGQILQSLGQPGNPQPQVNPAPQRALSGRSVRPPEGGDTSKKNGLAGHDGNANGNHKDLAGSELELSAGSLSVVWERVLVYLTEKAPILASQLRPAAVPAIFGPNSLVIRLPAGYNYADSCSSERSIERIQDGLQAVTGRSVTVKFEKDARLLTAEQSSTERPTAAADRRRELMQLPLLKKAADALGAQLVMDDPGFNPLAARTADRPEPDADVAADPEEA
jgi:DNA polymerase-3 subunit gamma/tau